MEKQIVGTGLSGLVGSRIVELLSFEWEFINLSLDTGVDICDKEKMNSVFESMKANWFFHFAAYTDVDSAESQRALGEKSLVWKINVEATEHIVQLCKKYKKRMLYVSTDYVFDGKKEYYTEEDTPSPVGWYGETKYESEKKVADLGNQSLIVRTANPYRAKPKGKIDFVHKIVTKLTSGDTISAPMDQYITPTYIDDIAYGIQSLITQNAYGVFHLVGGDSLSAYNASIAVCDVFDFDKSLVKRTTFNEYFLQRAPRPCCAVLKHDKITKYGINPRSFREGLEAIKLIEGETV